MRFARPRSRSPLHYPIFTPRNLSYSTLPTVLSSSDFQIKYTDEGALLCCTHERAALLPLVHKIIATLWDPATLRAQMVRFLSDISGNFALVLAVRDLLFVFITGNKTSAIIGEKDAYVNIAAVKQRNSPQILTFKKKSNLQLIISSGSKQLHLQYPDT